MPKTLRIGLLTFLKDFGKVFAVAHGITAVVATMVTDVAVNPLGTVLCLIYCVIGCFGFAYLNYWSSEKLARSRKFYQTMAIHDAVKKEMKYNLLEKGC